MNALFSPNLWMASYRLCCCIFMSMVISALSSLIAFLNKFAFANSNFNSFSSTNYSFLALKVGPSIPNSLWIFGSFTANSLTDLTR